MPLSVPRVFLQRHLAVAVALVGFAPFLGSAVGCASSGTTMGYLQPDASEACCSVDAGDAAVDHEECCPEGGDAAVDQAAVSDAGPGEEASDGPPTFDGPIPDGACGSGIYPCGDAGMYCDTMDQICDLSGLTGVGPPGYAQCISNTPCGGCATIPPNASAYCQNMSQKLVCQGTVQTGYTFYCQ